MCNCNNTLRGNQPNESENCIIWKQTKPEFSTEIAKSSFVVRPVAKEIHTAVFTSLKHLMHNPQYDT